LEKLLVPSIYDLLIRRSKKEKPVAATKTAKTKEYTDMTLSEKMNRLLIGQDKAISTIVPFIEMHLAGLAPEGRPLGVVMLLGPTGAGKTRTTEALAEALHGSPKNTIRIDCAEFQMDHEVAKLIGAPPGYLGHRETQALLQQSKINGIASENSQISIIVFDEIEKAAPSLCRMLFGVLDKASLRLGDNTSVNFENCLIFMTSNVGEKELKNLENPAFGFSGKSGRTGTALEIPTAQQDKIGTAAIKRRFDRAFFNRLDAVITYRSLNREDCANILELVIEDSRRLISTRLGMRSFRVEVTAAAKERLIDEGVSPEFGARELKRVWQRRFIQPLASMVANGDVGAGRTVTLGIANGVFDIRIS
jgi:ATP-dependent Clp protease ATP-binding subunit ClpA